MKTFFGVAVLVPAPLGALIVTILTCLAGTMAGLVLCVFSLDVARLSGIVHTGSSADAARARRLLAILEKPHWLLIALLTWNDIALEMLPLVLNTFLPPAAAIITSVAITLVFCEILPQAFFIQHAFELSAFLSPFIRALMWITAPVAWPMSALLDAVVGDKEAFFFQRRELREVIRIQDEMRERKRWRRTEVGEGGGEGQGKDEEDLKKEEVKLMLNVLSLSERTAKDMIQLPIEKLYKWHIDALLSPSLIAEVFTKGYHFIPVYEDADDPTNVTQILMTKMLLLLIYQPQSEGVRVREMQLVPLQRFSGSTMATEVFMHLQRISPSIVLITSEAGDKVLGLLTLRTVSEQLHETTFQTEMDPLSPSSMQVMVCSWRAVRRVGEYSISVSSRPSSLNTSFALIPATSANERPVRCSESPARLSILVNTGEGTPL
ncbi:hypothetical protein LSCM1_01960 [Leishmania martiniquensis]|uniref:CNNM transmembrane domain-containing protein n=1 Tax=Leishmania martiniquensis TaxID=1580590 RepID=A0A836GC67_9TRYP|nr:hypothetical protein LSCM1_01960 [Leishmania martiniquensis]